MDSARFDALARALASISTRRRAVKTIMGGTIGGVLGTRAVRSSLADHCEPGETHVSVLGWQPWTDTGINVTAGDMVAPDFFQGIIKIAGSDPGKRYYGDTRCTAGSDFPVPGDRCWQLIARIGSGRPFNFDRIDSLGPSFLASRSGRLYFGVNDANGSFGDNTGAWSMCVPVYPNHCDTCCGQDYCPPTSEDESGYCCDKPDPVVPPPVVVPPGGTECSGDGTPCGRYGVCLRGFCRSAKSDCLQNAMADAANADPVSAILANFKKKKKKKKNRCGAATKELFYEIADQLCFQQTFPFNREICAGLGIKWGQ